MQNVKVYFVTLGDALSLYMHPSEGLMRDIHWLHYYVSKLYFIFHQSTKITNELDDVIQGLTWSEDVILSPLIVPTATLETIMTYIE